jgi:hypothetical protein
VGIVTAVQLEPGVYELTDEEYFSSHLASTTLSSTGARRLLDCPAKFRHDQLHGRKGKREFDVGHAAHQLVLGAGPALVYVDAEEWRTKAVKEQVAAIREAGAVPLRPSDWDAVHDMASALLTHPLAPKLFTRGDPERTLIWRDAATGVPCRAKADWLRPDGIVDYKTARTVRPASLPKAVHEHGYYIQAAFYLRGFRDRFAGVEPFFAFVSQEKEPPYLVTVFQLTDAALAHGDRQVSEALERYRDCLAADEWPGYSTDIEDIELPGWVRTEEY